MSENTARNSASQSRSKTTGRSGAASTADTKADVVHLRPLTEAHIAGIEERGLEPELMVKLGVAASEILGGDAIAIPYFDDGKIVGRKHRTLSGEKRFVQDKGSAQIFWNVDCLRDDTLKDHALIICEGEMDAIAAIQAGFLRVVSVPGGAPMERIKDDGGSKYAFLTHAKGWLDGVEQIILAVDGDSNGANLREDLALRLGAARCKYVTYPKACKDLNDALVAYGTKGVTESIARAKGCKISGYYEIDELPPLPELKAYGTGIVNLDELYKLRLGDFTVITGIPGSGKTTVTNEICARMAARYGWKTVFASFEQQAQTDHRRALRTFYHEKLEIFQSEEERAAADVWIREKFGFIVPGDDDDPTLEWFMKTASQAVLRKEAQILNLDPWNELSHEERPAGMSQTEYVGFAIKILKKFARKYRIHLIVAAHPAKLQRDKSGKYPIPSLYDISDSANWANKADVGIVVHREDATKNETLIRVVKARYHQIGKPGEIKGIFDITRSRFTIAEEEGL